MELYSEFTRICKENGWKNTPQRYHLFCAIYDNLSHPTVDILLQKVRKLQPSISRESVYRILNEFAEAGLIMRLDDLNSAHYDWRTSPHGHFICSKCGKITDFEIGTDLKYPAGVNPEELSHVELRLVGVCSDCRKKQD